MKKISVIIPTHNRQKKIIHIVEKLRRQNFLSIDYEIIVVDDGSDPPVNFSEDLCELPRLSILRLEGEERSTARNKGAQKAVGELLVFIDDDISVDEKFLTSYWKAHRDFPNTLLAGKIVLPEETSKIPFGRFRQKLEENGMPKSRGTVDAKNLCAAGNMGIEALMFHDISGFDAVLTSSEDQDFALRHTAKGRKIAYLPEVCGVHFDDALDIRSYCRRNEWGSRLMKPFYERYPELPANIERERINGSARWGREPLLRSLRKNAKAILSSKSVINMLFRFSDLLEVLTPSVRLIDKTYRVLLGLHIFRGYRSGMKDSINKRID